MAIYPPSGLPGGNTSTVQYKSQEGGFAGSDAFKWDQSITELHLGDVAVRSSFVIRGSDVGDTDTGIAAVLAAGPGGVTSGNGGAASVVGGSTPTGNGGLAALQGGEAADIGGTGLAYNGGDVWLTPGLGANAGRNGLIIINGAPIPTSDPLVHGALWSNAGVLTISVA